MVARWVVNPGSFRPLIEPAADLDPGVEPKFVEHVGDVGLNGALGQEQPGCNLLIAEAVRDEPGDFELPAGERGRRLVPDGHDGLWPLRAAGCEGGAFVDCHGAAAGECSVMRLGAEPTTGGRF